MNEILSRAQLLIRRPAPDVYDAFVNPDVMTRFWFPRSSGRLEAGKSVRWYVTAGDEGPVIDVRVRDLDPGKRIQIEWGGDGEFTNVTWTFEPQSPAATLCASSKAVTRAATTTSSPGRWIRPADFISC